MEARALLIAIDSGAVDLRNRITNGRKDNSASKGAKNHLQLISMGCHLKQPFSETAGYGLHTNSSSNQG
jgi:hypothetical protein